MVDGVGVGEIINVGKSGDTPDELEFVDANSFQDADMVVIIKNPLSVKGEKIPNCHPEKLAERTVFECYGIYGNNLVTSSIGVDNIKDINKKYVWAYRKPYILNGDLNDKYG